MKIILATGGSGGHIFPAIKTAEYLKRQGHQVYLAGALSSAQERLKQAGFEYFILDVEGFRVRTALRFLDKMFGAIPLCKKIIADVKPDVVAGFGSYSSFPMIFAAKKLGIRTLLHEQNVIPGKANMLSSRFVETVAVSFKETEKFFPKHKVVWTGCPCNSERPQNTKNEILKSFGLQEGRRTIVVLGGSQGSHFLNEVVYESLPQLDNVQVIHMTGRTDYEVYREKYSRLSVPSHVCAFVQNVEGAYTVADIVIARAGAATVCELAAFGVPSILVPYPYAHGHQTANARVLEKAGKAVVIEQSGLNAPRLTETIRRIFNEDILADSRISEHFIFNPVEKLAELIVSNV